MLKGWSNHITEQPLHTTLKQYRVIAVTSVFFIGYMMVKAWVFFELNHTTMNSHSSAGFFTFVAALLGAFVKCVSNIQGKQSE